MAEMEMAIRFHPSGECRIVRTPINPQDTVGDIIKSVLAKEGVQPVPGCDVNLQYSSQQQPNVQTAKECDLRTATGEESWAGDLIYPNGWHLTGSRKATRKVQDAYWAPVRPYTKNGFPTSYSPFPTMLMKALPTFALAFLIIIANRFL